MDTADFDHTLSESAIALFPVQPPERARMMVIDRPRPLHKRVVDLPHMLKAGDLLIVNNSRVVRAVWNGTIGGKPVEATMLPPASPFPPDNGNAPKTLPETLPAALPTPLPAKGPMAERGIVCDALVRPGRRFVPGRTVVFDGHCRARVIGNAHGRAQLFFADLDRAGLTDYLERFGQMPIPPYIRRRREGSSSDDHHYQSCFAAHPGSVAAPTASLHFTPSLLRRLHRCRIRVKALTLHVGPGTFASVRSNRPHDHVMEEERFMIPFSTLAAIRQTRRMGGRIIAVGTTVCRTLESIAGRYGRLHPTHGATSLFILPGWRWRIIDALLTNFHLPRSTLFMLTCAFAGIDTMRRSYDEAKKRGYRSYSYGDCCLIFARNHHR